MAFTSADTKKIDIVVKYLLLKKKSLQLSITIKRMTADLQSLRDGLILFSSDNNESSLKAELETAQLEQEQLVKKIQELELRQNEVLKNIKLPVSLHTFPTYTEYMLTLRKVPSEKSTYDEYLLAMKEMLDSGDKITKAEKTYVESRQIWTDVVAQTNEKNAQDSMNNQVKEQAINRIRRLGHQNAEVLCNKILDYIQENARLTVSFGGFNFNKTLSSFQLLNLFERDPDLKGASYRQSRDQTETYLFSFLSTKLKNNFTSNKHARPHYGAIKFDNKSMSQTKVTSRYGQSFFVLKDIAKLNALFVPMDSMDLSMKKGMVCTYQHLEFLLLHCTEPTLKSLINRATGQAGDGDYFEGGGYFEIMLPPVNILDSNLIEVICLDSNTHLLTADERGVFDKLGISVINTSAPQYKYNGVSNQVLKAIQESRFDEFKRQFIEIKKLQDIYRLLDTACKLNKKAFIDHIYDVKQCGSNGIEILNYILVRSIEHNQFDIFKSYIEVDNCFQHDNSSTLLLSTLLAGREDMAKLLLEKKAGMSLTNAQNLSVMDLIIKKHPKLLEMAMIYVASIQGEKHENFISSLIKQHKTIYKTLVENGSQEGLYVFFLFELEQKRDQFRNKNHTQAADDATTLLNNLKKSYEDYQIKCKDSPKDKQEYMNAMATSWKDNLDQARETKSLNEHRGFKNFLVHLALFVSTAGVGSLVAMGYTMYKSKGKNLFFQVKTNSIDMLDGFNEVIKNEPKI